MNIQIFDDNFMKFIKKLKLFSISKTFNLIDKCFNSENIAIVTAKPNSENTICNSYWSDGKGEKLHDMYIRACNQYSDLYLKVEDGVSVKIDSTFFTDYMPKDRQWVNEVNNKVLRYLLKKSSLFRRIYLCYLCFSFDHVVLFTQNLENSKLELNSYWNNDLSKGIRELYITALYKWVYMYNKVEEEKELLVDIDLLK